MSSGDVHYAPSSSKPQQWTPALHLQVPVANQSSFPSPVSPSSTLSEPNQYPPWYQPPPGATTSSTQDGPGPLSLNMSGLSVNASSSNNVSPVHPSALPSSASTMSPITPISPAQHPFGAHHQPIPPQFTFTHGDDPQPQYDVHGRRLESSGRSSASSSDKSSSIPKKRSFTHNSGPNLSPMEEYDNPATMMDINGSGSYDEAEMGGYPHMDASPVDEHSSGEQEDHVKGFDGASGASGSQSGIPPGSINIFGKPAGTNNFVTKLYQMINDPKSANFIQWTDLGTSFVVSNVGEFSRSILGSHFKHNNFSSFVRQLNMYGFHKINRTPRAQRTSTDAQTWEFSHNKFLRGRPDLLDEIKRKALDPDPSIKQRVELPGEVAAQLAQMRDENRRVANALNAEKAKVERLAHVTKTLYDMMAKAMPGQMPMPFPSDLVDPSSADLMMNPFGSTATPHAAHFHPPALPVLTNPSMHPMQSSGASPNGSPTSTEFPPPGQGQQYHQHPHPHPHPHPHHHSLSRHHSFQHLQYGPDAAPPSYTQGSVSSARYEAAGALSTSLPPSPGPLDPYSATSSPGEMADGRHGGAKRQRTGNSPVAGPGEMALKKTLSRARSDSAPLGYALGAGWGQDARPRSGSGLAPVRVAGRRDDIALPTLAPRVPASGTGSGVMSISAASKGQ
ncbi:hypothetical protein PUNSTDRAFT_91010 [Punctularia strigosozonata HHB-11173 SS5]|uniref:uncharacterized protein n=1 Tax=Punctularia strigosozonata (strain HHB-11173) TaxID=741275 RepID=UPI00044178F1|nr:uncharacterized protein PUNSTDRAFT_91010 [Punctularia strigosozonata HHB-11173 SS5]EIN06203.1 hypothetical protein PUNSTDRAFT_91010 [Punctularia strigosozonata HHB-11173 SS5]